LAKFNYAIQLSSSRAVQLVANLVSDLSQAGSSYLDML